MGLSILWWQVKVIAGRSAADFAAGDAATAIGTTHAAGLGLQVMGFPLLASSLQVAGLVFQVVRSASCDGNDYDPGCHGHQHQHCGDDQGLKGDAPLVVGGMPGTNNSAQGGGQPKCSAIFQIQHK